jgi:hypothetical protein
LFGLMVALWITEEAGRRLFMARLEFWQLVLNDSIYVVASLASVVALRAAVGSMSLDVFLGGMALGAAAAITVAVVQSPREELRRAPVRGSAVREVTAFGTWRSAQAGIRPLALLVMRVLVAAFASRAALGRVEAARLLLAPAITFVGGAGSFLLSMYSEDERGRRRSHTLSIRAAVSLLVGAVCLYGLVALVFTHPLSMFLTAGSFNVNRVAVAGWALFAAGFGAGLPASFAAIARRQSREVFLIRVFDSGVGLALVVPLVLFHMTSLAPMALAFGMFIGAVLLTRLAARSEAAA